MTRILAGEHILGDAVSDALMLVSVSVSSVWQWQRHVVEKGRRILGWHLNHSLGVRRTDWA